MDSPVFIVGSLYLLTFERGESWIGRYLGEYDDGMTRMFRFDVGLRVEEDRPEVMIADVQTRYLAAVNELPDARLNRDDGLDAWIWGP